MPQDLNVDSGFSPRGPGYRINSEPRGAAQHLPLYRLNLHRICWHQLPDSCFMAATWFVVMAAVLQASGVQSQRTECIRQLVAILCSHIRI